MDTVPIAEVVFAATVARPVTSGGAAAPPIVEPGPTSLSGMCCEALMSPSYQRALLRAAIAGLVTMSAIIMATVLTILARLQRMDTLVIYGKMP